MSTIPNIRDLTFPAPIEDYKLSDLLAEEVLVALEDREALVVKATRIDEVYKMFGHPKKGEVGYETVNSRIKALKNKQKG